MKLPVIIALIFFVVLGYVANTYFFKFPTMPFIGAMLLAILVLLIIGNFFVKARNKKKGVEGESNAFIFPDNMAKGMKKMDIGIQYETSVLSSALLIIGIILFLIYFTFFTQSSWIMKGLLIFNSLCGIGLMFGMMVTYYHQLLAYRESTKFLHQYAASPQNKVQPEPEPEPYEEDLYEDEPYDEQDYDYTNERRNMR